MKHFDFNGVIGWQTYNYILNIINEMNGRDFCLDIDSVGGDVLIGFELYDILKKVNNCYVRIVGECNSASVLVYISRPPRFRSIVPRGTMIIHPIIYEGKDGATFGGLSVEDLQLKLNRIYFEHGLPIPTKKMFLTFSTIKKIL